MTRRALTRRLRCQEGFTVMELMMAMALMIIVLAATLTALQSFEGTTRTNELQNDSQEAVRNAMDQIARELRNHAAPTPELPLGVEKAEAYDLVFQTVNPDGAVGSANKRNARRVRYCLDYSNPENARLLVQSQTWADATPPAVPSTASCPDAAWGDSRVLADRIVNQISGARPFFTPTPIGAPLGRIERMQVQAFVDVTPATPPAESRLDTGIFFRNQNEPPVARFSVTVTGNGHIFLNASDSTDPKNDPLFFRWYDNGTQLTATGSNVDYEPQTPGSRTIRLKVIDPGGLTGTYELTVDPASPGVVE